MRLIILGAGGFGRTKADLAEQTGQYDEILFLDDKEQGDKVIGIIDSAGSFINADTVFYPAIGNNEYRCELIKQLKAEGAEVVSFVHSSAYVSPIAKLGDGVAILPHACVGTGVVVCDGSIINMNAVVDHDTVLEQGVHVAPGAIVKGENHVPEFAKVESGSVVGKGSL